MASGQGHFRPSNVYGGFYAQTPGVTSANKPKWFESTKATAGPSSQSRRPAYTQQTTPSGRKLIDSYFTQTGKQRARDRDDKKEMMKLLEKKLLNTNVDEYLKETCQ